MSKPSDAKSSGDVGGNLISNASDYFSESVDELKKVSTPTRQETMQASMATLVLLVVVAVSLFILDIIFGQIMTAVLS